jgi:hypothetical protein
MNDHLGPGLDAFSPYCGESSRSRCLGEFPVEEVVDQPLLTGPSTVRRDLNIVHPQGESMSCYMLHDHLDWLGEKSQCQKVGCRAGYV